MTTTADLRAIEVWRFILTRALSDCSTVDFHNLSAEAVDNLALVAAQAVQRELSSDALDTSVPGRGPVS